MVLKWKKTDVSAMLNATFESVSDVLGKLCFCNIVPRKYVRIMLYIVKVCPGFNLKFNINSSAFKEPTLLLYA